MAGIELRRVGSSGLLVSSVGVGCNNFGRRLDAAASTKVVHAALERGVTLFDTADIYGDGSSEEILGNALKGRRESAVVATKFGGQRGESPYRRGGSRRWVRIAVEESLRRLGTDWIDLYQMHFPDDGTPIEETLQTLHALALEGKVRYIGSSNFEGWRIADAAHAAARAGYNAFISAQNEYSLVNREAEREVIPACARFDIGFIPYYPLGGGFLTGKYRRAEAAPPDTRLGRVPAFGARMLSDRNFDIVEGVQRVARDNGCTALQTAIGWLLAQPQVVSVIAGAMSPEQVAANVRAGAWKPAAEDVDRLNRLAAA